MVKVMKGGGRAPSPAWANFTLKTECMPESSRYYTLCTLWADTLPLLLLYPYMYSVVWHAAQQSADQKSVAGPVLADQ
jgi:hypothetical protein